MKRCAAAVVKHSGLELELASQLEASSLNLKLEHVLLVLAASKLHPGALSWEQLPSKQPSPFPPVERRKGAPVRRDIRQTNFPFGRN